MLPDLLYVALFAVVGPLIDSFAFWPAHRRLSRAEPAWARRWLWASAIGHQWMLVGFGAALWVASDRSWTTFGLSVPDGWRLWASIALFVLLAAYQLWGVATIARSSDARAALRRQFGSLTAVLPHTRTELSWFGGVSLTAGFCEEFLYRGYFIWVFAPWLGWWGAAALSLPFFAIPHLLVYRRWDGVLRSGIAGAIFTLVVAMSGSLWPAIALHALVDFGAGLIAWLALREESTHGVAAMESQSVMAEPRAAPDRDGK